MSLTQVGSSTAQTVGRQVLQQLLASGTGSADSNGLSGILGDLLSLSPAGRQLSQAPDSVTQAMKDLFSGQKDVKGDLEHLTSFFQQNPANLASVLGSLQGGAGTYGATGTSGGTGALLASLVGGSASASETGALLGALMGSQGQNPLFALPGDSANGSGSLSLFG